MADHISRFTVTRAFSPLVPVLNDVVSSARAAITYDGVRAAFPDIDRRAGYNRIRGGARWLFIAEELVRRAPSMPDGFGPNSTEKDHNQGRYSFQWPLGLVTVRREPHEPKVEGHWFQERLDKVFDQLPLAPGLDADEGVKAFISVPAEGLVSVSFTHPSFEEPMTVALDAFSDDARVHLPKNGLRKKTNVRSTRKRGQGSAGTEPGGN